MCQKLANLARRAAKTKKIGCILTLEITTTKMVTFQILDCYSQDLKVIKETESEKQVVYDENEENDEYIFQRFEMVIHLFGRTTDNKSIRVSVNNFKPYFYIELPDSNKSTRVKFQEDLPEKILQSMIEENKKQIENAGTNKYNLSPEKIAKKIKYLKTIGNHIQEEADNLHKSIEQTVLRKEKLYGYTKKALFPFVKLSVNSMKDFRNLQKVFLDDKNNSKLYKVYEANLDPMLRFFHLRNIQPCGWVSIDEEYSDTLNIDWNDVMPFTNQSVAPFVCGFWDIECYSANGDFPLPKKDYYKVAKQLYVANNYLDLKVLLTNAMTAPFEKGKIDGIFLKSIPSNSTLEQCFGGLKQHIEDLFAKKKTMEKDDFILHLNTILKTLNKKFPIAGDPIIQIGIVFSSNGLGEKHIFVLDGCDPIEGVIVHNCKTEKEMILGFMRLVTSRATDMLLGYNTFGFDMKYVYQRMEELVLTFSDEFQNLSRIIDISTHPVILQEKKLSSSALGDNTLYLWTTTGRLHIDLYYYIKRIENLASYKLDDVCRYYMSGKLKGIDITKKDSWLIQTTNTSDAEVGKYLVLLDEMGDTIVEKRKILEIVDGAEKGMIIESAEEYGDLDTIVSWAIVKDDVSPAEIFRLHREGGSEGRAIVGKYCIQDCVLVYQLFNKLDVFNNAMAMANTCSVPISYIFTRGQGIKCESLIFKECAERNQLIEVLTNPINKEEEDYVEEKYEGAIVLVPEPNFYVESPIGIADFASLYPSTIYSENISYDTLLWAKDYGLTGKFSSYSFGSEDAEKYLDPSVAFTDIDFDIWAPDPEDARKNPEKIKIGLRVCRYVQQADDAKGTLPNIVSALLASRKRKRKEAEKENDPFKKALLDAEQLAYKLTANSLYGQLGSSTFKVRLQHLAASTTAYGRKQILFAKDAIETFYGPGAGDPRCSAMTVYGDTDSLFINFNVMNPETGKKLQKKEAIQATMALTEEAGKFVTRCLKKPHDFEYDKVFFPFIIFSKKRYVGNKYEDKADCYKQTSMGIATKRRDYAGIVKNVYGGAIKILLNEKNSVKAFDFVKKTCNDLIDGKISDHQLTLTKSLRSEYKAAPAHKMLADRITARDPGNAPSSGDRMQFMYVMPPVGQSASKLQGDRIETPSFIKENGLKIDYKYYIEHQIYNPITQLFGLFVDQLPGYVTPKKPMAIEEKEHYAGELLFRDIYTKCDNQTVRSFAEKFGFTIKPGTKTTSRPIHHIQTKAEKKKEVVNFPKLDRYLISNYEKEKKEKEKKDKGKKEKEKSTEPLVNEYTVLM